MARYKLLEASFIDNVLHKAEAEIEVDAKVVPGTHWEPLDDAAKAAHKAMLAGMAKVAQAREEAAKIGGHILSALEAASHSAV